MQIPERAMPRFGRGAWRGTVVPDPSMPATREESHTSAPFTKVAPTAGFRPVNVTASSAGNRVRLGRLDMLQEWWSFIGRMSGLIFRRTNLVPSVTGAYTRGMSPTPRHAKLVASRRVIYEPQRYGPRAAAATTAAIPAGRRGGVVAQRDRLGGKVRTGRRWER